MADVSCRSTSGIEALTEKRKKFQLQLTDVMRMEISFDLHLPVAFQT